MKFIIWNIFCVFLTCNNSDAFEANKVTYNTLVENRWTDHVKAFDCLFSVTKVHKFLEFGLRKGTKFF